MRHLFVLVLLLPLASAHDGGVGFDTAAEASLFPQPSEVQDAILAAGATPGVTVHEMGASMDGLPLRMLEVTSPTSSVPVNQRVVTFVMSQQHGNEPAGTPAALELIDQITGAGPIWNLLDNQVLLLLPQSNPDGAIDGRRTAKDGTDINRDHVALTSPEARSLHEVLNRWDVHVAFDHHEYGGVEWDIRRRSTSTTTT